MADFRDLRPEPLDLTHHLNETTRNRTASDVKRFYKYFQIPGIRNLAGGVPNYHLFPFDTLGARVAFPTRFQPTPNDPVGAPVTNRIETRDTDEAIGIASAAANAATITVPHQASTSNLLREIDVKTALQYGTAQGYPPLCLALRQFTRKHLHPNVPYKGGPDIVLTCGNTDGMSKSIAAFTVPWQPGIDPDAERQGILCEEFTFTMALGTVQSQRLNVVPVAVDEEGMRATGPGGLKEVLENWDYSKGCLPHLMYTITVGQNPTSGTLSITRRRAIYALCVKYDIIIIEDDPYWYLQYPSAYKHTRLDDALSATDGVPSSQDYNTHRSSGYAFLDSLIPSYLSIDYQGRVVRLDTFSKTVAPGCRLGWITAQPALIERFLLITENSTQQPSGFVQALVAQLLLGTDGTWSTPINNLRSPTEQATPWKMDGWIRWLEGLRGSYERRMSAMCSVLDDGAWLIQSDRRQSLDGSFEDGWVAVSKTQMYSFAWPRGGMFVWIRLHPETHPLASRVPLKKLVMALWEFLITEPYMVLASPGEIFSPTPEIKEERAFRYFRLCFAAVDDDLVKQSAIAFSNGVKAFWMKTEIDELEEVLARSDGVDKTTLATQIGLTSLAGRC